MKPKFAIGDFVHVEDIHKNLCVARVTTIKTIDGQFDYHCRPVWPADDLCNCGQDCTRDAWFLETEVHQCT